MIKASERYEFTTTSTQTHVQLRHSTSNTSQTPQAQIEPTETHTKQPQRHMRKAQKCELTKK